MNSNKPKVSGSVGTVPLNPVGGPMKRKTEQTEGGGDGNRLAGGNGTPTPTGKYNLAKEVARLREENRKLKEGQEQQQRLLKAMQMQIEELRCQVFGEAIEPEVESNDEATTSDAEGNGENFAVEIVTEPISLKADEGLDPTDQVVRNQFFAEAKAQEVAAIINMITSGSQGNGNNFAVGVVAEPVSRKSEVPIPTGMQTVDKVGLCYYVLQTGTDFESILEQINKIDPTVIPKEVLCEKLVAVKRMELTLGPERLLRDFILPFCRGNPEVDGVFNKLDRRTVWLHGPSGMGKETWLRKEFPPEQGYLYVYSRQDLKQFKSEEHKGIVAVNLQMSFGRWSAVDMRHLVGCDLDRSFSFSSGNGRKKIEVPRWTQRIVTSEQAPSEMFGVYKKYLEEYDWNVEYFKENMWKTIAVHVTRPILSLIPSA